MRHIGQFQRTRHTFQGMGKPLRILDPAGQSSLENAFSQTFKFVKTAAGHLNIDLPSDVA